MRTLSVVLIAPFVLLAACSGGGEAAAPTTTASPTTTVATTSSTTATTVAADPFAVPADPAGIDAAYVETVANELYRILGDAGRILMDGGPPEEVVKRYDAVYAPRVVNEFLAAAFERAAQGSPNIRPDRGNAVLQVTRLREATTTCILADVVEDASAVVVAPLPPAEDVLVLHRSTDDADPLNLNRTPWVMEGLWVRSDADGVQCADL